MVEPNDPTATVRSVAMWSQVLRQPLYRDTPINAAVMRSSARAH